MRRTRRSRRPRSRKPRTQQSKPTTPSGFFDILQTPKITYGDRVTVAMATHDPDHKLLHEAVQSILDQDYPSWRLIIVVDGGPPVALEIEDPRVVVFHSRRNESQFYALEIARRATDDPIFAVMDDDDVSLPNRLSYHVELLERECADVVFGPLTLVDEAGKVTGTRSPNPEALNQGGLGHIGSHVGMWKTASLEKVGGYYGGGRLVYDTLLGMLVSKFGKPAFAKKSVYRHFLSPGSMTRNPSTGFGTKPRKDEFKQFLRFWEGLWSSKPSPEDALQQAAKTIRAWGAAKDGHLNDSADELRRTLCKIP